MAEQFRRNLLGTPLGDNAKVIVDDVAVTVRQLAAESFDVIVLSLVLSSMPALPDFGPIARLLAPGGLLVVTDISPGYTTDNPLYKVATEDRVVALRTKAVEPYEVIRRAIAAGLRVTRQRPLGEGNTYYSFLTVFAPVAIQPDEQLEDGEGLILT